MIPDSDLMALVEPDRLLEDLVRLFAKARSMARPGRVELYHRASARRKVALEGAHPGHAAQAGFEEGLAVRLDAGAGGLAFASASGRSEEALAWAVGQARCNGPTRPGGPGWAEGRGAPLLDRVPEAGLPSADRMVGWLGEARSHLDRAGAGAAESAWIESAVTVETLVAEGGLVASRSRTRTWAVALVRDPGIFDGSERPRALVGRRLGDLPVDGWVHPRPGREEPDGTQAPGPEEPLCLVVPAPEPAGLLVRSLVRAFHTQPGQLGGPVGPGWRVADDPLRPEPLGGGTFDDAGHATRRKLLADGSRVVGLLEGEGHLRRPSYRDPPAPLPSVLVVEASGVGDTGSGLLVTDLRLHTLDPESWVLELSGVRLAAGRAKGAVLGALIRTRPEELLRRCVAATGPARASPNGVVTPGLVFDGLRVERGR